MATPNLGLTELTEAQSQKTVTINNALTDLDNATQGEIAFTITGNRTVTAEEFLNFSLVCNGTPGGVFDLTVPETKRFFRVENNTGVTVTVKTSGVGSDVDLLTTEAAIIYNDGANLSAEGGTGGGGGNTNYDIPVMFGGTPITVEVLGRYILGRTVDFVADFAGSVGAVETNPAATFDIDVKDDGTSIGTVSISTGGVFTFTTVGGSAKSVISGSKLEFVAPASVDANIVDITLTLLGDTT